MTMTFARKPKISAQSFERTPPTALKLLSVQEAADCAKVSTQTVRRAIKGGCLKTYRAGRQIRIDEADLVQYLSL